MIEIIVKVNDKVSINGIEYDLKDITMDIPKMGLYTGDYILNKFYDLSGINSKFSIARKLKKTEK